MSYSVPLEAKRLLLNGLVHNPLHSNSPLDVKEAVEVLEYVGSQSPAVHINWRFAESISAIKGYQAAMLNVLLKRKYGVDYQKVVIDTDHAQLFVISVFLPIIDPEGEKIEAIPNDAFHRYFPDCNIHNQHLTSPCTNIYRTKDKRFYHVHGSLNHTVGQRALGITDEEEFAPFVEGRSAYQAKVAEWDSQDLDVLWNDTHRQASTICQTKEEYLASEKPTPMSVYTNFTMSPVLLRSRLGGKLQKVIDLTRIIASPVVCRELAEMGASVLRITSPNITDLSVVNLDMQWGKWNAYLDLTKAEDRVKLKELVEETDVFVDGYQPGVMQKWGFGCPNSKYN